MEPEKTATTAGTTMPGGWARMPSIGQLFSETWTQFSKHFTTYVGIMAIPVVLMIILLLATLGGSYFMGVGGASSTLNEGYAIGSGIMLFVGFIVIIVMSIWSSAALVYAITHPDGGVTFAEAFRKGWTKIGSYLWVAFLMGILMLGGYGLFFVPMLIFSIWFIFAAIIVMTDEGRGFEALMKSREYVRGYWWSVFGRNILVGVIIGGIYMVIIILAALMKAVILIQILQYLFQIFYGSFVAVYGYRMFLQLKTLKGPITLGPQSEKDKKLIIWLTVIGYIVGVVLLVLFIGVIAYMSTHTQPRTIDYVSHMLS